MRSRAGTSAKLIVTLGKTSRPSRPLSARCRSSLTRTSRSANPRKLSSCSSTRIPRLASGSPQQRNGRASNRNRKSSRSLRYSTDDRFHPLQVCLGVHSNGVEWSFGHMNCNAVFEEAQLFQPLAALKVRFRPSAEGVQRSFAIGIEAQVFVVAYLAAAMAIERNRRPGEVECTAVKCRDHFHRVGIVHVLR